MEIDLKSRAGFIDIYLLDQIMKGRFHDKMKILDAGCGRGRNSIPLIRNGAEVYCMDRDDIAIGDLNRYVFDIDRNYPSERFISGDLEELPFETGSFDGVISNAVLHFASNRDNFEKMFSELVRVLRKGGVLFCRTATDTGLSSLLSPPDIDGWSSLPDGTRRFLTSGDDMKILAEKNGCCWFEPFKTVVVDKLRAMSTIVLKKEI